MPLTKKERQKVYSRVRRHLLKQGRRAIRVYISGGRRRRECMFHAPTGEKCALGCLINKVAYTRHNLKVTDYNLPGSCDMRAAIYDTIGMDYAADREFFDGLMDIHDDIHPNGWKKALDNFAENWGLKAA